MSNFLESPLRQALHTQILTFNELENLPASIKSGRAYKPERSAFYSTFARLLSDDSYLSSRMALCLSSRLTNIQAHSGKLCTHKWPTVTFNELENLFSVFFLSVGGFLQSSAQPHESTARSLQRAAGHIKGHAPLVDSGYRHEKV